jgi:hypothetical protein
MDPCHHGIARPEVANGETACRYGGYLQLYLISRRGQQTRGGPTALWFGEVLTDPHRKNLNMLRIIHRGLGT